MSDTTTLTLSEFLRERLREEEDAATGHYKTHPDAPPHSVMTGPNDGWVTVSRADSRLGSSMRWSDYRDLYLIPAEPNQRVLEDIMSKRAIVDEHSVEEIASLERETWGKPFLVCRRCRIGERQIVYPCPTLRLLAAPYRTHPDYRSEWA